MKNGLQKWLGYVLLWILIFSLISQPALSLSLSKQLLDQGIKQFQQQNYSAALTTFSELMKLDNKLKAVGYSNRCLIYLQVNEPQKALLDCQSALKLNPNNTEARLNLGLSYYRLGYYQDALQEYQKIINANIKDYRVYYNQGLAYAALNADQKALNSYNRALTTSQKLSFSEQALIYNDLGLVKIKLGDLASGIADLSQAIDLDEENHLYYYNRGRCYHQNSQYREALQDFNQVIALNSQNTEAYFHRSWLNHRLGNQIAAIADLQWVLESTDQQSSTYQKARQLMRQFKQIYAQTHRPQVA